ncbi:RNA polymerase sigma factor sigC [Panicum miliaceum]|uniref:RNA polymerase sigma factor sigC n=1 Tax=Panicum miliaceum TaxID=4540 RepID=A0A3L6T133_PANMI|nr:RNA polymerase sigma factor sigC [Panicum miliaceum]
MAAHPPKQSPHPSGGRSISSESLAALALHLVLKRRKYHGRDIATAFASSSSVLQITENKSSSLTKPKAERKVLDDALDRNLQYDWMDEETLFWLDMNYTNSNLQYGLLMENLQALENSLAGKDLKMLEKDILVHIEQLGALGSFNASMSRATLDTLTQTSHEPEFSLLDKVIKFDPETPLKEQDAEVIVRSGKSQERKQKRMRASEKASRVSVKECANLEKIREDMMKEGQEVSYQRWAEEAGVDEAELKRRLQAGYCCRERLIVTTEWLVRYIARTYTGMGTAFDDLLQAGKMGVLDGAEKFDSRKGCKFSTYVKYWIRKGMLALLAENSGVTLLPARMECIIRKVKEARRAIRYSQGRNPSDSEIAAVVGVSVANVRLARKCSRRVLSLYSEIGIGQNAKFTEVIPDPSLEAADEAIFRAQLRERLLVVLDRLPAREGHVLKLRHGLEDGRCMSLEQIGRIYRVSKEWIRKIEKSAMARLRNQDVRRELDDFCSF